MKFKLQHQGKWVVAKNDKIIADDVSLNKLMKKIEKFDDVKNLKFSLVPKGYIAGLHL